MSRDLLEVNDRIITRSEELLDLTQVFAIQRHIELFADGIKLLDAYYFLAAVLHATKLRKGTIDLLPLVGQLVSEALARELRKARGAKCRVTTGTCGRSSYIRRHQAITMNKHSLVVSRRCGSVAVDYQISSAVLTNRCFEQHLGRRIQQALLQKMISHLLISSLG